MKTIHDEVLDGDFSRMITAEFDFHFNYDDSVCFIPTNYIVSGKCHNVIAVTNQQVLQGGREVLTYPLGILVGLVEE